MSGNGSGQFDEGIELEKIPIEVENRSVCLSLELEAHDTLHTGVCTTLPWQQRMASHNALQPMRAPGIPRG